MDKQSLKKYAIIAAVVVGLPVVAYHGLKTIGDIGSQEEGYAMGMLYKWSAKGIPTMTTGEGQLLLGNASSSWSDHDDNGNPVEPNPWNFSTSTHLLDQYGNLQGQYVVVHFYKPKWILNNLNGDTNIRVLDIKPVKPNSAYHACGTQSTSALSGVLNKSDGDRAGRLVAVSQEGYYYSTDEATIQLGDAGNKPLAVSFTSSALYECARLFLGTGQLLRFTYQQARYNNPLFRNTEYDIIGITPVTAPATLPR